MLKAKIDSLHLCHLLTFKQESESSPPPQICIPVEPRSSENHVHNNSVSQNMKKIYFCSYCGALPFTIRAQGIS